MKIIEAITRLDNLTPNQYTTTEKVGWLNTIDQIIYQEIIETHTDAEIDEMPVYTEDDLEEELIASAPHDEMYPYYMAMQIDIANGDTARYENDHILFTNAHSRYKNWYNRTHMPLTVHIEVL